jgi:hypothetical protein
MFTRCSPLYSPGYDERMSCTAPSSLFALRTLRTPTGRCRASDVSLDAAEFLNSLFSWLAKIKPLPARESGPRSGR